jgi:N6-adenosine-specific RNA methylase IME4
MIEFHEIANIFPMLAEPEAKALAADVKANGLINPIVLYQRKILDGRNRAKACARAGVAPRYKTYRGKDPLDFVLSLNLARRHLNEVQLGMTAETVWTIQSGKGGPKGSADPVTGSLADVARRFGVSEGTIKRCRDVRRNGAPALIRACEAGLIPANTGAIIARLAKDEQRAIVARIRNGTSPMEAFRIEKAAGIVSRGLQNPTGKFRIIYADPPWDYDRSPEAFGSPRDHYPTMTLEEICNVPVKDWTERNAVLFLWTTSPKLEDSFKVIAAWGFAYKASFVWDKITHHRAHYNSMRHEFLLVCTRGACQPDNRKSIDSVYSEKRTTHSTKPAAFYEFIETLYPKGARLEMFHRGSGRKGWETYGFEDGGNRGFTVVRGKMAHPKMRETLGAQALPHSPPG